MVRDGKVVLRRTLLEAKEGGPQEIPGRARFQITPENRLLVFVYVSGKNAAGEPVSENRLIELYADGSSSAPVRVPLKHPMGDYFTATVRGGSPPSRTLELLGHRAGSSLTVSFARIKVY